MSDFVTNTIDDQFYTELINRFFHSKSYFYICITKYLEHPSSIEDNPDGTILKLLSSLIQYLNEAKQPARELNEITLIEGFGDIYSNLEMQLIRYDLRSLKPAQLKKAIQNIALNFLKYLFQLIASNEKGRKTLTIYLQIKAKLNNILNGSNGNHANNNSNNFQGEAEDQPVINNDEQPRAPLVSHSSTRVDEKKPETDNINLLNHYFEREISRLLKPLAIYSNKSMAFYSNVDFIRRIQENFLQIQELAMYHGYEEVEAISTRISKLMATILSTNHNIDEPIIQLIYDAKAAIEKNLFHQHAVDDLGDLLDRFDYWEARLQATVKSQQQKSHFSLESENPETSSFEINPSYHKIEDLPSNTLQKRKESPIFSGFKTEEVFNEAVDRVNLQSDDDEALLKFVQEVDLPDISSNQSHSPDWPGEDRDNGTEENHPAEEMVQQDREDELDGYDASTIDVFQKEAALYYKILQSAIIQLKNEEKVQAALEDIELAGSSLKYLAQKFGMEKLALLPELMESISILTNEHIIKMPAPILQGIEEGVQLLTEFDLNNKEHKIKFMSILTSLKEYYSKTFNMTQKIMINT